MRKWRKPTSPGSKTYAASGGDPSHVASVASFFISRIDSMVDSMLKAQLKASSDPKEQALLKSLMGKVAIANAKLTYQRYKEILCRPGVGGLWRKRAPRRSGCCGPAPAPRIPVTRMSCMSKS